MKIGVQTVLDKRVEILRIKELEKVIRKLALCSKAVINDISQSGTVVLSSEQMDLDQAVAMAETNFGGRIK
jgi:hypothetical protein